jgi:hypothetical protein
MANQPRRRTAEKYPMLREAPNARIFKDAIEERIEWLGCKKCRIVIHSRRVAPFISARLG